MRGGVWHRGQSGAVLGLVRELARSSHLRVVVASRTSAGRSLPLDHWAKEVLLVVLPFTGGATEIRATGHWLNPKRRLITEPVRLLDMYLPWRLKSSSCQFLACSLAEIAWQMCQERLAVVVGHRLHLIPPRASALYRDTASRRRFLGAAAMRNRLGGRAV